MLQNAAQAHQGAKATLSIAENSGAKDHWQQVNMQSSNISSSDNSATHDITFSSETQARSCLKEPWHYGVELGSVVLTSILQIWQSITNIML